MISVFLVDDHELVRTGIRRILEDVRGLRVLVKRWWRASSSVVQRQPVRCHFNGHEYAWHWRAGSNQKILRFNPDTKIIVLTVRLRPHFR